MSTDVGKLRLGPLPKIDTVKLTVVVTSELQANLEHYAALHARSYGETVDVAMLVPHMLQAFMARDRGFQALRRRGVGEHQKMSPAHA